MTSISPAARNFRLALSAAATLALVALAACGGGGGGAGPQQRVPGSTSFRPCTVGLSYNFTGNSLRIISRPLPPPSPAPPSPQPSTTIAAMVGVTTAIVSNSASFGGHTGLTQLHSSEQDATALQTTSSVTDDFVSCPANDSGNFQAAGWTSSDSNGVTVTLTYGAGNGLVDILPETSGAQWTNSAALHLTEVDADGQTTNTTVNADGSYTQNVQFPDGTTSTATERSDGSASYSFPFGGPNAGANDSIAVGTPNPAASGGPAIPIVLQAPSSSPQPLSVPDWYPPGPIVLASETDHDLGSTMLPSACNVPSSIASSGNKIVRTTARLDTIFGEIEQDSATTYTVAGVGVVCSVISDVLNAYYDYTGQGPNFSALAQQVTTFSETIGAQGVSAPRALATQRRSIALRIHLAQQHFARLVALRHARQARALRRFLSQGRSQ